MRYIASGMMALALGGCTLFQAPRHQASPPSFRVAGGTAQEAEQHAQTALEAGRHALDQGQTGLAIEAFRQALDAGGSPAPALNGLGVAYARLGDLETAARLFEEASAMAPDQASYHANMARAAEALGQAGPTQAGQALAVAAPQPVPAAGAAGLIRISPHEVHLATASPGTAGARVVVLHGAPRADPPSAAAPTNSAAALLTRLSVLTGQGPKSVAIPQ